MPLGISTVYVKNEKPERQPMQIPVRELATMQHTTIDVEEADPSSVQRLEGSFV